MSWSPPDAPPPHGERLDGRYLLGERLGRGGTGSVRRAHDEVLQREVAVKLLGRPGRTAGAGDTGGSTGEATGGTAARRRLLREEARLAGALQHPGIAQIFDYVDPSGRGDPAYIVMELVEGVPLAAVLEERGALSPEETLDVLGQAAAALQVAHSAGIVHRDLTPRNMMVAEGGRVVLVDFGIARAASAGGLTAAGTVVGTADYLSPEQARGSSCGAGSDLYALGVVAYECLTGERPFHRDSAVTTARAHLHDPLPELPAAVPPRLANLVRAMTSKRPGHRPADATTVLAEVAACAPEPMPAVESAATGAGIARALPAHRAGGSAGPAGNAGGEGSGGAGGTSPGHRYRWTGAVLAAAVLVLVSTTRLTGPDAETVPAASAGDPGRESSAGGDGRGAGDGVVLRVPRGRLLGRGADEGERVLAELGLATEVEVTRDGGADGVEPGTVVGIEPASRARSGSTVTLLVTP